MTMRGAFITATGTGVGKTYVTRGIARALRDRTRPVAAVKPLETGCEPDPQDALALARACGRPELARAPGLYRAEPPLAPYAATLGGSAPPPKPHALASTINGITSDTDILLVEGAGGLLVPLDRDHTMADLAQALALPLLLVAHDGLGVLSHTLTAYECAQRRGLHVGAAVLVRHAPADPADPSTDTNVRIIDERIDAPVLLFPPCDDDDATLARATVRTGLVDLFHR